MSHSSDDRTIPGFHASELPPLINADRALVVVKRHPFNAEAPLRALCEPNTPTRYFYVRSNFATPSLNKDEWRLTFQGEFSQPFEFSYADLEKLPARTVAMTMECAGNDRHRFAPLPKGEPWGSGALSTGTWRGVSLRDVIEKAGMKASAVEILFEGADFGIPDGGNEVVTFARALPVEKALDPDTILAYEMNGEPLPLDHGGPVRLVVPDWYGVASVKWLVRITAIDKPFEGWFQTTKYVLEHPGSDERIPLREMLVKSMIAKPSYGESLPPGPQVVTGWAWSGGARIAKVEVCVEAEGSWQEAALLGEPTPHTWQQWSFEWTPKRPGRHVLRARATDEHGNTQPDMAPWNRLGYANNSIQSVVVDVKTYLEELWDWNI